MRLGPKSRFLMDFLFHAGLDLIEIAANPRFATTLGGGWEDQHRFNRDLRRLEERGLIEKQTTDNRSKWVVKLTALGEDLLADTLRPESFWNEPWDGKWKLIAFDLPQHARNRRRALDTWLRSRRFGMLQGSTWISPRFPDSWKSEVATLQISPSDISFFEGASFGQSTDADFVREAWNFKSINKKYKAVLEYHSKILSQPESDCLLKESLLWKDAFDYDPLLPDALLPADYLGKEALKSHRRILSKFAKNPD